jgi:FkbM family methyltransferase
MGIMKTIAGVMPRQFKDALRPFYETVFDRPSRDRSSRLAIASVDGFELAYREGTADERQIQNSFSRDVFFSRVPEYRPAEDHVIIDVGAHIGTFAILMASKTPRGHVYAIEASRDSANFLRVNVALNRCTNVSVHQVAITDREGTCTLYHAPGTWGHSITSKRAKSSEVVTATTLATFLDTQRIGRCHFMKLNCEGAEFPILLSTPAAVLQRFQMMVVLYHLDLVRGHSEADLVRHLEAGGFACEIRNRSEKRGWIIAARRHA